eukprot:scaffold1847_cov343-Prasinococcus_capsulatus_cf.AAC.7
MYMRPAAPLPAPSLAIGPPDAAPGQGWPPAVAARRGAARRARALALAPAHAHALASARARERMTRESACPSLSRGRGRDGIRCRNGARWRGPNRPVRTVLTATDVVGHRGVGAWRPARNNVWVGPEHARGSLLHSGYRPRSRLETSRAGPCHGVCLLACKAKSAARVSMGTRRSELRNRRSHTWAADSMRGSGVSRRDRRKSCVCFSTAPSG